MTLRLPAGVAVVLAVVALAGATSAGAAVRLAQVGTFERPTYVTAPPGDTQRVVVVEQTGQVRLIKDGTRQAAAFLDVSALSTTLPAGYSERGLFSVAFAPDYASSGLLYAYYTAKANGNLRVDEFRRGADPDRVDAATRRPVLEVPHDQQGNHNGGQLQFGPDGMLYIGTGDGGAGNDPANNGQNLTNRSPNVGGVNQDPLLGKLLRIDPRGGTPYAVPADNPFPAPAREVWSLGLRNPYRFSFDRETDDLIIGDVGQNRYEEIDFAPAGGEPAGLGLNFGWKPYEGLHTAAGGDIDSPPPAGYAFPVVEHAHTASWCSVTGGYVVRDPALPDLAGQYVYGDYCLGRVYAARLTAAGGATSVRALDLPAVAELSSFGEDACGRVYVTSLTGAVSRLTDSGQCILRTREPGTPEPAGPVAPLPDTTPSGTRDSRAPRATLTVASRQRVLPTGFVTVRVRCDEHCTVRANGRVAIRRLRASSSGARAAAAERPLRVRTRRATLAAGARTSLRLRIARSTRARIDRALKRPRRAATAVITIRTTDRAGNTSTRRVSVRIVRRLPRR